MVQQGHSVELIAKGNQAAPSASHSCSQPTVVPITGFDRTGSLQRDLVLDFFFSVRALFILRRTDILVLNTFWSPVLALFFFWKYRRAIYNVQRVPKKQLWLYRRMDALSTVSGAVARVIANQDPAAARKTVVIPNPVDYQAFARQSTSLSTEFGTTVVFTGRIHPEKGVDLLVAAAARLHLQGVRIRVKLVGASEIGAGGGGESYLNLLRETATGLPLEVVPPVSGSEAIAREIASGQIYCYPSIAEKGETFGVSPLEAMATGIPVVVSSLECFQEFATDGINALVFEHRQNAVDNLAAALFKLINDENLGRSLAKAGKETAIAFSIDRISDRYLDLFRGLLHELPIRV